ncbi:serine hydrolase domain-containing protein [Poritiphilus flavus]|uniref:Serine hydrolase n=1 Tax=Poritiphilus flavus TaxID=2697053 RepID=A0A6L9EI40_9FLAO|nr:serine hydrolase domain-containing protein [Poritiphilus flavus]NAS13869.1 serine hydrolase [Poritiphilus flavus]
MNKKRNKRILRIVFPLAGIISLFFVPWLIVRAWMAPLPDTVQEQLDNALNYDLDGTIVYVDQNGKPPEFYASGWNNRDKKIPADPHTLFKIASISKLYVAVTAVKVVNSGALSLDDSLADLLPEYSGRIENADEITLRLMLQHRSGIPNYMDDPDYPWSSPPKTNLETLELVLDAPADFDPDERYSYSNTNFLLIGEILDKTLGYSHHQYINEEILTPLKLKNTYNLLSEVNLDEVMSGYFIGYEPDIKANDFINPGGSMVATAEDVGIFLRALNDGSLLTESEQKTYSSVYVYEHTGLLPGYQSIAKYHRDMDTVVILFVNTSGGNAWSIGEIVYSKVVKILRKQ